MASLLTTGYNAPDTGRIMGDLLRMTAEVEERAARLERQRIQEAQQEAQQALQDQRRAFEFDRTLEFNRAKDEADNARSDARLAMEREIYLNDNAPVQLGMPMAPMSGAYQPPQTVPNRAPSVPLSAPAGDVSGGPVDSGESVIPVADASVPANDAPAPAATFDGPIPQPGGPAVDLTPGDHSIPTAPTAPPVDGNPATHPINPGLPVGQGSTAQGVADPLFPTALPNLPAQGVGSDIAATVRELQAAGIPVTNKTLKQALPGMLQSGFAAQQRAKASGAGPGADPRASWKTDEHGYKFNPENPAEKYTMRHSNGKTTYTQVKPTDSGYGLKPAGDGLFEDENGARFFVDKVSKSGPTYKRVEEDAKVTFRTKDAQGRVHSFNQFGAEVAVTPEWLDFATPKTKPYVGSDGEVYSYDSNKGEWLNPPPAGVTFDSGKSTEAKVLKVGTDGKVYGFKRDGEPIKPIPDGVRFDKPKDESAVAKWEVDEKTGDLHGFNFQGKKVVENEGDYTRAAALTSGAGKAPTMNEQAVYEGIAPTVKGLWKVMDEIRATGEDPHAPHQELVDKLGSRGQALSDLRNKAQKAVAEMPLVKKKGGRDFAEGFVRAFESRQGIPATATPAAPAATTAAPPPPAATGNQFDDPEKYKAAFAAAKPGEVLYYKGKPYKKP